jgi:hypothetical protein
VNLGLLVLYNKPFIPHAEIQHRSENHLPLLMNHGYIEESYERNNYVHTIQGSPLGSFCALDNAHG